MEPTTVVPNALPAARTAALPVPSLAGACDVFLVADRNVGTTYHFLRGWRFEAWQSGRPAANGPLLTVAIDPQEMARSGARYAMAFLAERPSVSSHGTAAFAWSPTTPSTSDPLADGRDQAHRLLIEAGWTQDAHVPTRYRMEPA